MKKKITVVQWSPLNEKIFPYRDKVSFNYSNKKK